MRFRTVPRSYSVEQAEIQGSWFDCDLIEALIDAGRSYGFEGGTIVLDNLSNRNQLKELERKGLARKGTKGSWYGLESLTLIEGIRERFG